jgi:hypothetical protein
MSCVIVAKKYKNQVHLHAFSEVLSTGSCSWKYNKPHSGEDVLHDHDDVKMHWLEKMCKEFKKPTGNCGLQMIPRAMRDKTAKDVVEEEGAAVDDVKSSSSSSSSGNSDSDTDTDDSD